MKQFDKIPYHLGTLLFAIFLDQTIKSWAHAFNHPIQNPYFGLFFQQNFGAMLGMVSSTSPLFRIITFCTFGAFMISLYALIQYLLPFRSTHLRFGLTLLLAGILGNVIDRAFHGYVTDFIYIGGASTRKIVLNLADITQWFGYGFMAHGTYLQRKEFWREKELREQIWINPNFQFRYCIKLIVLGLCYATTIGVFSTLYLKYSMQEADGYISAQNSSQLITTFLFGFTSITAIYVVILVFFGKIESHKTAGAIFSFERYVRDLITGKDREFKLRAQDEFKNLEDLGADLRIALHRENEQKNCG